jgi:translation initiation factor IF-3
VKKARKKFFQRDTKKIYWVNEKIRAPELLVIDENGSQLGIMPTRQAIAMARQRELDLVEVSPQAQPPVAKILDYGQFKYQQDKQEHKQKVKQKKSELKVIRLSVRISQHDLETRLKQGQKFLEDGDKIKAELMLKGREMQHQELALEVLKKFQSAINQLIPVKTEQAITRQGRSFSLILTKF